MKMLPKGWQTVKIENVCKTFSGGTPSRQVTGLFGGTIPWIKSGELNAGDVWRTEESITEEGLKSSSAQIVEPGTNLIALYGATAGVVGRSRIRAAINQAILAVVPLDSRLISDYLQFLLQRVGAETAQLVQGAQPNLNAGMVQTKIIALPPKKEQIKIAAILQTWADAIKSMDELLLLRIESRTGLMQQLLTGKIRFNKFKNDSWRTVQIGSLFAECDRYVDWRDDMAYRFASIRRRSGGLFDRGTFFGREVKTKVLKLIKAGDFLISKRQVVHGAWAMVVEDFEGFGVSDEYDVLVNRDQKTLDTRFFNYLSRTRRLWHMAYMASNGVHIEKLIFNFDDFAKEKIKIPQTVNEQAKIVEVLSACDHEIKLLKKQLEALKEQKRGMMQKLLTGEIRVKI